jgi:hypothetical protein
MPQIWKSSSSAPVRILRLHLVLYRLVCTGSAASDMEMCCHCWVTFPLTGEGAMLTCRVAASARTVAAHTAALLQQIIITLCSRARRCDVTTRRPFMYIVW